MSNIVQGLCYKTEFKCPKRKAIAVAMGDHAHDDGSHIWPSIGHLARKTEWSDRTVQRVLRELEVLGLIVCIDEGGKGAKDTREYRFDMDMLRDLADGAVEIVENEGDQESPCIATRVTGRPTRVTATTDKGDHRTPEPSRTIKEPSGAAERASDKARAQPAPKAVPQFTLTPADSSWAHWITWLTDNDRRDLVIAAQEARQMVTVSRWPTDKSPFPRVNGHAAIEKRKTGEAA